MESSEFLKTALLYEETDYPSASLRFYLNEARIRPEQTPAEVHMLLQMMLIVNSDYFTIARDG